ncbi:HEAT repeat domain-containing protein [Halomicrobium sp. IBSBa]|uniref:HEAT repeat domain-containing protein n=1 Tax=Halomicrobium sp. IBSBa TaxID=2778916 RepID=UPI001ABF03CA|nr:HEAT repeat domain-containing protein [Halomicrobium sp. IBSBa]MBO4248005.1 HEAT repeat domain-containing protein [Halomicrobium sp. IBSBa]
MSDSLSHGVLTHDIESVSADEVSADVLRSGLEHETNLVRTHAVRVAAAVADDDPATAVEHAPQLIANLEHERTNVKLHSALALASLVDEAPEAVEDAVGPIVDLLDQDPPILQLAAVQFVRESITTMPRAYRPHLQQLVDRTMEDPAVDFTEGRAGETPSQERAEFYQNVSEDETKRQWATRVVTANMIAELASIEPAAVADHIPTLVGVLDSESDAVGVLTTVANIVASVAEHDPTLVDGAVDPLVELLAHHDTPTVSTAVAALGFLAPPAAIEPLRDVAADEQRDEDLRELASETATFIEEQADA